MDYRSCPHYDEMVHVISNNKNLEGISFELDEVQGCRECSEFEICNLWMALSFVVDMRPQLALSQATLTIDNLDAHMSKIAHALVGIVTPSNNFEKS
jgi:hypothetical protein